MNRLLLIPFILFCVKETAGQDYLGLMQKLYNASKARQVTIAKISHLEEKEGETQSYSQYVYSDNRKVPYRAIHRIEENETIFFDGLNTTYSFFHNNSLYTIDTGMAAVIVFKNKMGALSQILLARKETVISGINASVIPKINNHGNGRIELVLSLPGQLDYNLSDKRTKLVLDSTLWIPRQFIDTVYALERLVRVEETVDSFSTSPHITDSIFQQIKYWLNTYALFSGIDKEEIKIFPFQQIFEKLEFLNYPPPQSEYYLFDFYFAGCVPCYQCMPFVKSLEEEFSKHLAIIAINPIDKVERIERFNRINNITSPSATLSRDFLVSIAGELAYPTYILYDKNKNEIARSTDCDPAFFEQVAEIISRE